MDASLCASALFSRCATWPRSCGRVLELAATHNVFLGACPRVAESGRAEAVERCWTLVGGPRRPRRARAPCALPAAAGDRDPHGLPRRGRTPTGRCASPCRPSGASAPTGGSPWRSAPIWRPPIRRGSCGRGSFNHKHRPPRKCVCTRLELVVFALGDVVGHLPDTDHYRPAEPRTFDRAPIPAERSRARPHGRRGAAWQPQQRALLGRLSRRRARRGRRARHAPTR